MKYNYELSWVYHYDNNRCSTTYIQRADSYAEHKKLRIIGNTNGPLSCLMKYICLDVDFLLVDCHMSLSMSDQKLLASFCRRKQIHIIVI